MVKVKKDDKITNPRNKAYFGHVIRYSKKYGFLHIISTCKIEGGRWALRRRTS